MKCSRVASEICLYEISKDLTHVNVDKLNVRYGRAHSRILEACKGQASLLTQDILKADNVVR